MSKYCFVVYAFFLILIYVYCILVGFTGHCFRDELFAVCNYFTECFSRWVSNTIGKSLKLYFFRLWNSNYWFVNTPSTWRVRFSLQNFWMRSVSILFKDWTTKKWWEKNVMLSISSAYAKKSRSFWCFEHAVLLIRSKEVFFYLPIIACTLTLNCVRTTSEFFRLLKCEREREKERMKRGKRDKC